MTMIAILPGDGIGAEILEGPIQYLTQLRDAGLPIELSGPWPYGTTGWRETGSILPASTIEACREADVIFSGAVGAHPGVAPSQCPNPEAALIELRHLFDLRVSVRTVWVPGQDDVIVVRNITGGAYAGPDHRQESDGTSAAEDRIILEPSRVREVLKIAATHARLSPERRHISVDKASVFATSRLWRRAASELAENDKTVHFENVNVDRAGYELIAYDDLPGVVVTEGIFGDILSDVLCARAGSPALCGSATINPDHPLGEGCTGLFEPAHGSAPRHTGTRRSNPAGAWLSLASLLDWCPDTRPLGLGRHVRTALSAVHAKGVCTYDLAPHGQTPASMDEYNQEVLALLAEESCGALLPNGSVDQVPAP